MNKVIHFEIPSNNKEKSKAFYGEVFGWQIKDIPVKMDGSISSYTTTMTVAIDPTTMIPIEPGAINGAIRERKNEIKSPIISIEVDSINDYLDKIKTYGCRIIEGKQRIENMGYYAYITDIDDNIIGLWENISRS